MVKRPYDLPAMSSLVAFEAAARSVSFKDAAQELNVTPAAVSHQVKALEQELRCTLFHRHHRGVDLTETGAYLFVALQRGFEAMSDAVSQLRVRTNSDLVTIHVSTAVSSLWLTPKLAQFWKIHGNVSVAQIVSDTDKNSDGYDLSIHYADMSEDLGTVNRLFHDHILALASPKFVEEHPISTPSDLAQLSLIHLETGDMDWMTWEGWLAQFGVKDHSAGGHRVNNYIIALQAAQDDMGVVLGWTGLTRDHIASGRLVPILPHQVETPEDFYIKLHPRASDQARLVYDWLVRDAGEGHPS